MKRLVILIIIFLTFSFAGFVWFIDGLRPVSSDGTLNRFVINQGETANQIGHELQAKGLIKNALSFRIYSQVSQAAINIKPGSYDLPANLWVPQLTAKLLSGPSEVWVTIPEGFRREEIASKFAASLNLNGSEADDFYNKFLSLTKGEEGYLFPDTYLVPKNATVTDVVKLLEDNFKTKVKSVDYNSLILASILERETLTSEERPIVAGILLKRINAGWPLQADATIQYITGSSDNWWKPTTPSDLQIDSAYNTYLNIGLPPTPICNPGIISINAALNPTNSDYWYYLHDKDGQIHYAVTIEEQNANIAKYLN